MKRGPPALVSPSQYYRYGSDLHGTIERLTGPSQLQAVYNYISSPVPRGIPGPWLAKFTTKWITFVDTSGYRSATLDKLHKRYGPVVQVAPNELSFSTIDAIKPIYGIGTTCIKSPAYDTFGRQGLFQMKDPEQHRQRLRGV